MSNASITSWTRLEPNVRDAQMATGARAGVFDPLWFLTRQWQMGEYQAEDAGMPVVATLRATSAPLTRRYLGAIPANTRVDATRYDAMARPLEVAIEARPTNHLVEGGESNISLALEAGSHFLRILAAKPVNADYRPKLLKAFGFLPPASDTGSSPYLVRLIGRAIDGRRLAAGIRAHGETAFASNADLGFASGDRAEVRESATDWLAWYDSFFGAPDGDAWIEDRLEYGVSVASRLSADPYDEFTLTALEYDGGDLGWSDFDLDREVNLGSIDDRAFAQSVTTVIPAPVTVPGAPAPRFWEIEQGLSYADLSAGPTDLARLMMIEYSSSYGNDWFVIPVDLPVGTVTRTDSLVVTDSFGVRALMRPIGDRALPKPYWGMWQLDYIRRPGGELMTEPASNLFFLPASLPSVLEGQALERVSFMRDEMANIAWAIELVTEGPLEQPIARGDDDIISEGSAVAPADAIPEYRLASSVPSNWIPLLPVQYLGPDGQIVSRLRRGAVLAADGSHSIHLATGQILDAGERLELFDEEVPREGVVVERIARLGRWIDGSNLLWLANRKRVGRGEGSSGLRFDRLDDGEA
jgi:hypothetical protein